MPREVEVMDKLKLVMDPELDQSLLELGFIDDVDISNSVVNVSFRLPTYWCSPNFAYLMASDIRDRIMELSWVKKVEVQLKDHSFANEVNRGVSDQIPFKETFHKMSSGDLDELRKNFKIKAFYSRQEKLIRYLISKGVSKKLVTAMSVRNLHNECSQIDGTILKDRYLSIMQELNLYKNDDQVAFIRPDATTIAKDDFDEYLLNVRRTRLSMEFNAIWCRELLRTRYHLKEEKEAVIGEGLAFEEIQ